MDSWVRVELEVGPQRNDMHGVQCGPMLDVVDLPSGMRTPKVE
jgi:hypothetical protein